MRTAILIAARMALCIAAVVFAIWMVGCAERGPELLDCRPDPELTGPDPGSDITLTVERKGGDLVWTDTNGIEHRITEEDSWMWHCAPHREI